MNSKLNHIIPIDFNNTIELPNSHTWFHSINNNNNSNYLNNYSTNKQLPIIPLIDLHDQNATDLIKLACEDWGAFQVTNHGVPAELFRQIEHETRRFFASPAEAKLRALRSPSSVSGYGAAPISRFFSKLMWSEGFTIAGSPVEHARRVWPHDYSTFCSVIEDYQEKMKGLAEKIVALMFNSLGLTSEELGWFEPNGLQKSPQSVLQLNSYPNCPDPTHAMGLGPHTDSSLITLLYQPINNKGLQIYRPNINNWADVEPIKNAIIVNIGDLMQIVTNGRFRSVLHQAIVRKAHHRISVAYFYGPKRDVKMRAPHRLIKSGEFPIYRETSWEEYLELKGLYFNKALDLLRYNPLVT